MSIELNKGLVLHQRLDQESLKSSLIFGDKTSYENDGTSANTPVFTTDHMGQPNRAMVFNGSSDVIDCGDILDPLTNDFSVVAWIKLDDYDVYNGVVVKSGGNNGFIIMTTTTNGYLRFRLGGLASTIGTTVVPLATWTHIVISFDRSGYAVGYINGINIGSVDISGQSASIDVVDHLRIGGLVSNLLDGNINEVRIYNRVLTQEEITLLYESYRPGLSIGSLYKDLVLDMPLSSTYTKGGAAGSEIMTDLTPYSNDGQNVGATVGADYSTFNGTTDVIRIPDTISLSPTSKISVFAWINGSTVLNIAILSHYDIFGAQRSFLVRSSTINPYDKLRVVISDNGDLIGHAKIYDSSVTAFDNTWHLIGFIFDAGTLKLYIDGVEDTSTTKIQDDIITTIHDSTADVMIGCYLNNNVPNNFYAGDIAKPRIWKRELSADEVLLWYEQTKGLFL